MKPTHCHTSVVDLVATQAPATSRAAADSRESNGNRVWIVEDPWRGKFYELGDAEQTLLAALNGQRTLAEAHASLPVTYSTPRPRPSLLAGSSNMSWCKCLARPVNRCC